MISRQVIQHYSKDNLRYTSYYPDIDPVKDLEDAGFFLSLANRVGDRSQDNFQSMNTFTLGISFHSPIDRVIKIESTSALHRQGYFLLPVTVEAKNNEEIKVELFKFSDKDDLIVPFHKGLRATISTACYHHLKKGKSNASMFTEQIKKEETSTESDFF